MKWHDEQEPENLGSGTYRLPLPLLSDGLRAVNVYLLAADNQLAVIDGGWAFEASRQAFAQGLRSLNAGFSDISRFLVTHAHADHYSQAIMLRREFGTRVSLGLGERAELAATRAARAEGRDPMRVDLLRRAGAWPAGAGLPSRASTRERESRHLRGPG